MSFISEYVLSQGTWAGAGRAVAMQVLALAKTGYVRIRLEKRSTVRLVRTRKQDDDLSYEEQFLLRAVFADAKVVVLNGSHQKPVAQSVMTVARARLAKERFIRRLSPRALQRRLYWGYLIVAVAATMYIGVAIEPMAGILIPFAAVLVWVPYNVSVRHLLRSRNLFYKRKGRRMKRLLDGYDARSAACMNVSGSRDQYGWFENLPAAKGAAVAALEDVAKVMAAAFEQRHTPGKGYYRDNELWYEGLRGAHEQVADFGENVRGNAVSYDGHMGDGGDGGSDGGGDGGDGGGDG